MPKPKTNVVKTNVVKVDAGTLLLIVSALILLPLLITGFLSQ